MALTDTYRQVAGGTDLEVAVAGILNENRMIRKEVADMGARVEAMVYEEANLKTELAKVSVLAADSQHFPYVMSEGRGRNTHVVIARPLVGVPPQQWRTRCGWRFGLSQHTLQKVRGPVDRICATCRPEIAEEPESGSA